MKLPTSISRPPPAVRRSKRVSLYLWSIYFGLHRCMRFVRVLGCWPPRSPFLPSSSRPLTCHNHANTLNLFRLAGVRGRISCHVTTIPGSTATYHVYELDVSHLENTWLEKDERSREWVDYTEALRRLAWKPELAQALAMSSLAVRR
jgi:hypothetical protein